MALSIVTASFGFVNLNASLDCRCFNRTSIFAVEELSVGLK
jgi:hypothetical protein